MGGGSTALTAKAVNKDLAGVKKRKKPNKVCKKCRGCSFYFKPEGMGSKSSFCLKDKRSLDCLTRVAKNQGKSKWLAEVRKDEQKIQKVLQKYDEMTGDSGLLENQARWISGAHKHKCMLLLLSMPLSEETVLKSSQKELGALLDEAALVPLPQPVERCCLRGWPWGWCLPRLMADELWKRRFCRRTAAC